MYYYLCKPFPLRYQSDCKCAFDDPYPNVDVHHCPF